MVLANSKSIFGNLHSPSISYGRRDETSQKDLPCRNRAPLKHHATDAMSRERESQSQTDWPCPNDNHAVIGRCLGQRIVSAHDCSRAIHSLPKIRYLWWFRDHRRSSQYSIQHVIVQSDRCSPFGFTDCYEGTPRTCISRSRIAVLHAVMMES